MTAAAGEDPRALALLGFWWRSGPDKWFARDDAFDAECATFAALGADAVAGGLGGWRASAAGTLALIVLTDQIPRNVFRGTAKAFAGDAVALATAEHALAAGFPTPTRCRPATSSCCRSCLLGKYDIRRKEFDFIVFGNNLTQAANATIQIKSSDDELNPTVSIQVPLDCIRDEVGRERRLDGNCASRNRMAASFSKFSTNGGTMRSADGLPKDSSSNGRLAAATVGSIGVLAL